MGSFTPLSSGFLNCGQIRTFLIFSNIITMTDGMFRKEKQKLEDEYVRYKDNYQSLFPKGMVMEDGTIWPLDEILQKLVYDGLKSDMKKLEKTYSKTSGRTHHWIGINPPPNKYTLLELASAIQDATAKYNMFEEGSYSYTLEQNTSGGIRPHIHLFLISTTRPNRIIETLAKHFKVAKPSIDLKTYRKDILWNEHLDYINGNKKTEKMENVAQDNLDKFELGIPQTLGKIIA